MRIIDCHFMYAHYIAHVYSGAIQRKQLFTKEVTLKIHIYATVN